MSDVLKFEEQYGAKNYAPLPVVLVKGKGIYVWDEKGQRYIDMLSAYSAVSHGHCHPKLLEVLQEQAQELTLISRAFYNNKLALWLEKLCKMTGMDRCLPMNTGAEAVETALKAARRWGYSVKGIAPNQAEIIACEGNFHGRTIAIVSMSTEPLYKDGFGPFPEGFKIIPYNDVPALKDAITPNTAAFLVEPIQGEAGIRVPSEGYLAECARICKENNVLFIADEVQCGLGRSGSLLACDHEHVKPDGLILGKALGGGILPISAFLARKDVMNVFRPGSHGSTFGGNSLATAISSKALDLLYEEQMIEHSKELGNLLLESLREIHSPMVKEVRGKGLFVGLEMNVSPKYPSARQICLQLMEKGILVKDTHETVLRFAPPLVITEQELRHVIKTVKEVFKVNE